MAFATWLLTGLAVVVGTLAGEIFRLQDNDRMSVRYLQGGLWHDFGGIYGGFGGFGGLLGLWGAGAALRGKGEGRPGTVRRRDSGLRRNDGWGAGVTASIKLPDWGRRDSGLRRNDGRDGGMPASIKPPVGDAWIPACAGMTGGVRE